MIKLVWDHSKGLLSPIQSCHSVPTHALARRLLGFSFPQRPIQARGNTSASLSTQSARFTQRPDRTQSISPVVFKRSGWQPGRGMDLLKRQTPLKVVSWNINFVSFGPAARVASALQYLQSTFGNDPGQMAILFQEVCQESAEEILKNKWVQENFAVVGQEPPQIFQEAIPRPARYFTLAMIPKNLRISNAFRMTLPSEMGRDGLFVDLSIESTSKLPAGKTIDVFRLCTTHLESLAAGRSLRARQLQLITKKLNEHTETAFIIAGLVGGDMNALHTSENALHRQFGLRDAWEDIMSSSTTTLQNGIPESAPSRTSRHNWDVQSEKNKRIPKRLDKFLYTGGMQTLPLTEIQERIGNVARLGLNLTAHISPNHSSDQSEMLASLTDVKRISVSDHLGIAMNVVILK